MNSGSKSCAALALGPKMRTPLRRNDSSLPFHAVKSAKRTVGCVTSRTSMIPTDPSGSSWYDGSGSPSFATRTVLPSGVKVTMSGSAPTETLLIRSSVAAR
jgi:hypothetical protein